MFTILRKHAACLSVIVKLEGSSEQIAIQPFRRSAPAPLYFQARPPLIQFSGPFAPFSRSRSVMFCLRSSNHAFGQRCTLLRYVMLS